MVRPVEKAQPDRRSDRLGHDRALRRNRALPGLTVDSLIGLLKRPRLCNRSF